MILVPPPLPVIKIVKYCGVWGRGEGAKILQKVMPAAPPSLSVSKIVKYCGFWGEGVIGWGRQNPTKDNGAPLSLSLR